MNDKVKELVERRRLTPEEIDKAFDNAFEHGMNFDHKPTIDEIFAIKLKAVAEAQLINAYSDPDLALIKRELPEMPKPTEEELEVRKQYGCEFIRHGEYFNTMFCGLRWGHSAHRIVPYMKFCEYQQGGKCNPKKVIAEYQANQPITPLAEAIKE